MEKDEVLREVKKILHRLDRARREISSQTLVITELDFDSLQMMELLEAIQDKFGVDLLAGGDLARDFRTPETMATAILRARRGGRAAG